MTGRIRTGRRAAVLRWVRVGAVVLVAGSFIDGTARAQDEPAPVTLVGFQGTAAASGVHVAYVPVGLLPLPSLVDIGAPDALATIASGPSTFARAATADPGDIVANPNALLALAVAGYPGGVPEYPYRLTASSGTGAPSAELSPAPGLGIKVAADERGSVAQATLPVFEAPAILNFGTVTSRATTTTDGSSVTVHARTELNDVDILGLVKIESIVTDVTASSDGGASKVEGGTTVAGATLLDQPVTIDADGVHVAGGAKGSSDPLAGVLRGLVSQVNEALSASGISITVADTLEQSADGVGRLAAAGLRIDLDLSNDKVPGLTQLLDALPPIENPLPGAPGIEDLLQIVRTNHVGSIELARAQVSLDATSAGDAPEGDTLVDLGGGSFASPSVGLGGFTVPNSVAPGNPSLVPAETTSTGVPAGPGAAGVILLALLALPLLGDRLAVAARGILGAGGADPCPTPPEAT